MDNRLLNTVNIAFHTLKRKSFWTTGLTLLVALFAFTLFGGAVLSQSMENGMGSLSKRMGVDILAAPCGCEADTQSALLRGEPNTFYFDTGITKKVGSVEGVEAVSLQLYIATLSTGCCSYSLQLVGLDPKTDFIIRPWMSDSPKHSLADDEIVISSNISTKVGQKLKFFSQTCLVAARLDKTGMDFDSSVFMNLTTVKQAVRSSERIWVHPIAGNNNLISSVIIKIKSGYTGKGVVNSTLQAYAKKDVHMVVAKNVINDIPGSLRGLMTYILILAGVLWILVVGVLTIVFSITLNGRRREFSILRILDATRGKLVKLILYELYLISTFDTMAGTTAAALIMFPFSTYISTLLVLSYLQPSSGTLSLVTMLSFLISFIIGPTAPAYAAVQIGSSEIYTTMKEGE